MSTKKESIANDPNVGMGSAAKAIADVWQEKVHAFEMPPGSRLEGVKLAVKWLPAGERSTATANAMRVCREEFAMSDSDMYSESGERVQELESMTQILSRAMCSPSDSRTLAFKNAKELRSKLGEEEIVFCYRVWEAYQESLSPINRVKTMQEVNELVDSLGKGTTPVTSLKSYAWSSLVSIASALAETLAKQRKAIFLHFGAQGMPSERSTPEMQASPSKPSAE